MAPGRSHTEVLSGLTASWLPSDQVGRNGFQTTGNKTKPELVKAIDASQSVT